jgi:DNA-directed RNA polymerase subunit beta'
LCLPKEIGFINRIVDKSGLRQIVADCYKVLSNEATAAVLDRIKSVGFHYATISGITIAASDIQVPVSKPELIKEAEDKALSIENQFRQGLIDEDERYNGVVEVWTDIADRLTDVLTQSMDRSSGLYMMSTSGAKGNISQIKQMAGMRGLMTNPSGRIIDFPIKSSLREGLSVLEYFISTHGARKGLADTALRTSGSGYLTRRLIDVAQDVITRENDCGTIEGSWIADAPENSLLPPLSRRIIGRLAAAPVVDPKTEDTIVERNQEIDEKKAAQITAAGITKGFVARR